MLYHLENVYMRMYMHMYVCMCIYYNTYMYMLLLDVHRAVAGQLGMCVRVCISMGAWKHSIGP